MARAKLDAARAELVRQVADLDRVRKEVPIQIEIARTDARRRRGRPGQGRGGAEADPGRGREGDRRGPCRRQGGAGQPDPGRAGIRPLHPARPAGGQHPGTPAAGDAVARLGPGPGRPCRGQAGEGPGLADPGRRRPPLARGGADGGARRRPRASTSRRSATTRSTRSSCWSRSRSRRSRRPRRALEAAEHDLEYTQVRAPFPGVVVKRYRQPGRLRPGGRAAAEPVQPGAALRGGQPGGGPRLPGVEPGNPVRIEIDAFAEPFRGRVVWVNKSTGAQFALMPRNVVSGEFTRVVQRVPVRIWIERDDRWPHAPRRAVGDGWPSPTARATRPGPRRRPARWPSSKPATTCRNLPRRPHPEEGVAPGTPGGPMQP